jgi:hypothetical protein
VAVAVMGCGVAPVTVGAVCEADAAPTCVDGRTVAYCESQHWQGYACPSGCVDGAAPCDWRGVEDGAPCPAAVSSMGVAAPFCDGNTLVLCNGSAALRWQRVECSSCRYYSDGPDCTI